MMLRRIDAGHALAIGHRSMLQAGVGGNVLGSLCHLTVAQRAQQIARQDHTLPAPLG